MATLQTAVAFAEMQRLAFPVGQDLEFNMAGAFDVFFDVDDRIGKRALRFRPGRVVALDEAGVVVRHPHPASAAAAGGLDDHGVADFPGDFQRFLLVLDGTVAAGHHGHTRLAHRLAGRDLVSHRADGRAGRADEFDVAVLTNLGEMRVFGEEPVTGVDRLHVAHFGGADNAVDLEIAFLAGSVADADGLVRQLNVERVGIRLRIDSQCPDTQFPARANDAHGDFTAIGYQDFIEHGDLCFQG